VHAAGVAVSDFVEALSGLGACDFGFAFGGEGGSGWVEAGRFAAELTAWIGRAVTSAGRPKG
jgi:hypothetical protein